MRRCSQKIYSGEHMLNVHLKIAIIQSGQRSYEIERTLGFWPGKLSKLIYGIITPSVEDRVALAEILQRPIANIFPKKLSELTDGDNL